MFGKICSSLSQRIPSTVTRRPLTSTSCFVSDTKRLIWWKKSARLKKLPRNSRSSGTVSSPAGVVGEVPVASVGAAPAGVEVWVSDALAPDFSAVAVLWLEVCCALLAASAAPPGWLCAVAPPAATGAPVVPDSEPAAGGAVVVVVAEAAVVRGPVLMWVKT